MNQERKGDQTAMNTGSVIHIHDLSAGYGRTVVLKNLHLTVQRGEAVGIAGLNGAGKTTLFKVILGLLPSTRGRVEVLGRDLRDRKERRHIRPHIGYVPQQTVPGKLPVSVHDMVLMGRWGKGFGFLRKPGTADRQTVSDILSEVGLKSKEWQDGRKLSGGEGQKASIARALVREAEILLLDEPTTYLDPRARTEITELIRELRRKRGLSLLVISHDPIHLQAMTDRIYRLEDGLLRGEK